MEIQEYSFGKIKVDGKTYKNDLIIFPDKILPGWWRKEGHSLFLEDLKEVLSYHPQVLIVGTGASGAMKVPQETKKFLREEGIEVISRDTREAVEIFNKEIKKKKRAAGAFHLTC
ncbi:MAG: hypothetical protein GF375_01540 [Candidatus Omnitrophica bacterium]|nr:hypothetical protein [Candidatus Omnitrophota bacterium]MBD3268811.1 hypothetical protein [Candidatus Omnitrophota bacterium]